MSEEREINALQGFRQGRSQTQAKRGRNEKERVQSGQLLDASKEMERNGKSEGGRVKIWHVLAYFSTVYPSVTLQVDNMMVPFHQV